MKIILRNTVDGLGRKGDVCDVADGYARNYLVPRGLAIKATKGSQGQAEAMRRAEAMRGVADKDAAEQVAAAVGAAVISIDAKAGEGGRLFGSVTSTDIAEAVQQQTGAMIDRRAIVLDAPIKDLGQHSVMARLHADVEFSITVEVTAD